MYRGAIIGGILGSILWMSWLLVVPSEAQQKSSRRRLDPAALTVIPVNVEEEETVQGALPLPEIITGQPGLEWEPNFVAKSQTIYERAKQVHLRRAVWGLEFTFKPLRMVEVDVPQPSLKMRRKLIWYMVYRVRYLGSDMYPVEVSLTDVVVPPKDFLGDLDKAPPAHVPVLEFPPRGDLSAGPLDPKVLGSYRSFAHPVRDIIGVGRKDLPFRRFFPHFVLRSHDHNKEYLDRVIPAALGPVRSRERVGRKLHNSVEMSATPIEITDGRIDRGVWGIVTWEDVDPGTDHLSVYVQGLTNAYKFSDPVGGYKSGDAPGTGRKFHYKTLQLNFWRPGDTVLEHEKEIRYGIPVAEQPAEQRKVFQKYGLDKRLAYRWIYR